MGDNFTYACFGDSINSFWFYFTVFFNVFVVGKSVLVIIMTFRALEPQKNISIVFASMTVNDLVLFTVVLCYQVANIANYTVHILMSNRMTSFMFGDFYGTIMLSIMHMMLLALDRYIYIAHPFYYIKYATRRRFYIILVGVWIIGLLFIIGPILVYTDDKYHQQCIFYHPPIVYLSFLMSMYLAILMVVFTCYFKIAYLAYARKKAANMRRMNTRDDEECAMFSVNRNSAFRSLKFLIIMFGMFTLCTFPLCLITSISHFYNVTDDVVRSIFYLQPFQSIVNIVVYIKINRALYRMLSSNCFNIAKLCLNGNNHK